MNNLILIGMPSSGKTTLGKMLAKKLNKDFLDTDDVIKQLNGCELQKILDKDGMDVFFNREADAIETVDTDNTVIATGGSAVYRDRAMQHLKSIGTVVYLYISYETLEQRLHNMRARGVAIAPGTTLRDLYNERVPLYKKYADITLVEKYGESFESCMEKFIAQLK